MVEVHLYGKLRALAPDSAMDADSVVQLAIKDGDTIADVLARLGITADQVAHLFLNHQYSGQSRRVHNGDRLAIFARDLALLYRQYFPKIEE